MAVTHDIGEWNDIHPANKKDVGLRLFAAAEKVAYQQANATATGPLFKTVQIKGNKISIQFDNTGSGLKTIDQQEPKLFAIAGADKKFVWAKAVIKYNNTVEVFNDQISTPKYVRYAWARNPKGANLVNKEGLPAVSFRTDSDQ